MSIQTIGKAKAIGYVRTGREDAKAAQQQIRDMQRFCEQESIALVAVVSFVGSELLPFGGQAGDAVKRMILHEGADLLVVRRVECLGRDWEDVFHTIGWLQEHNIGVYVLDLKYYRPPTTDDGHRKPDIPEPSHN